MHCVWYLCADGVQVKGASLRTTACNHNLVLVAYHSDQFPAESCAADGLPGFSWSVQASHCVHVVGIRNSTWKCWWLCMYGAWLHGAGQSFDPCTLAYACQCACSYVIIMAWVHASCYPIKALTTRDSRDVCWGSAGSMQPILWCPPSRKGSPMIFFVLLSLSCSHYTTTWPEATYVGDGRMSKTVKTSGGGKAKLRRPESIQHCACSYVHDCSK